MNRPLANIRPFGPFVQKSSEISEGPVDLDPSSECQLILQLSGVDDSIEDSVVNVAEDMFDDIEVERDGIIDIYFTQNRADYDKVSDYSLIVSRLMANDMEDDPMPTTRISESIRAENYDVVEDTIDDDLTDRAMRELGAYLKPHPDLLEVARMEPEPSVVFELHYDMQSARDFREVKPHLQKLTNHPFYQTFEIEEFEDRDMILLIPQDVKYEMGENTFYNFNEAYHIAGGLPEINQNEVPKLERMIATCTEIA